MADRGEPLLSLVERACDQVLDVGLKGSVRAEDELAQRGDQGSVFSGQLGQLRTGGVDQAHRVVGEVRCFDDSGPGAGVQAGDDVLAVLLVLIPAGLVGRIGDGGDQLGGPAAELPGQDREGGLSGASGREILRVVFDGVVQQRGAGHAQVDDPVMAEDPDRDPQQMRSDNTSDHRRGTGVEHRHGGFPFIRSLGWQVGVDLVLALTAGCNVATRGWTA